MVNVTSNEHNPEVGFVAHNILIKYIGGAAAWLAGGRLRRKIVGEDRRGTEGRQHNPEVGLVGIVLLDDLSVLS